MEKLGTHKYNLIGMGALLMWAVEPLLVSEITSLPIFELLTLVFASSFLFTGVRVTKKKAWKSMTGHNPMVYLIGMLGVCFPDFAYIYGAKLAPIAHVDLIDYLWPCFVILFVSLLPNETFKAKYIIGAFICFAGIYLLISTEVHEHGFNPDYFWGYFWALVGAGIWGAYSAFSRFFKQLPTEMIGMYCGCAAVICLLMHLVFETFVMPSGYVLCMAVLTGISGAGIAYQLWDVGVKKGNVYFLGMMTYLSRVLGMVLLVIFGKEPFTMELMYSCLLCFAGVLITSFNLKIIRSSYNRLKELLLIAFMMTELEPPRRPPEESMEVVTNSSGQRAST